MGHHSTLQFVTSLNPVLIPSVAVPTQFIANLIEINNFGGSIEAISFVFHGVKLKVRSTTQVQFYLRFVNRGWHYR